MSLPPISDFPKQFSRFLVYYLSARYFLYIFAISSRINYSPTFRKKEPKMRRLRGHFREMVAYMTRTTGDLFRDRHIYVLKENYCMQFTS